MIWACRKRTSIVFQQHWRRTVDNSSAPRSCGGCCNWRGRRPGGSSPEPAKLNG
ncbi:unnamed protein product [Cladocopium goreaui]|uniref:Uncharacterized protein n=1 Tax=Cladocopium goreaui TaxID=2562237 RepID=A0A9P1C087_9DINO|nr:unnamed protein product [Cladocopium goreaui]